MNGTTHSFQLGPDGNVETKEAEIKGHGEALDAMLSTLTNGPLENLHQLPAVAHRVGHGGTYKKAVPVDTDVIGRFANDSHDPAASSRDESKKLKSVKSECLPPCTSRSSTPVFTETYRMRQRSTGSVSVFRGVRLPQDRIPRSSHQYVSGKAANTSSARLRTSRLFLVTWEWGQYCRNRSWSLD